MKTNESTIVIPIYIEFNIELNLIIWGSRAAHKLNILFKE